MGTCQWKNYFYLFILFKNVIGFLLRFIRKCCYNVFLLTLFFYIKKTFYKTYKFFGYIINKLFILITIFIFLSLFIFFKKYNDTIFYRYVFKYLYMVVFLYSLVSTFVFLSNRASHGKYSSFIQRFYKRAFMLFWIVEFFLFSIFTYLLLIAPAESSWSFDSTVLIFSNKDSYFFIFFSMTILICISILLNICIYYENQKRKKLLGLIIIIVFLLFYVYIYIEFFKFYYIVSFFKYKKIDRFKQKINNSSYESIYYYSSIRYVNKARTEFFFVLVINIIKFWHVVLVFLFFVFSLLKMLFSNKHITYDLISSNILNVNYLLFFHVYSYSLFFKKYFYDFIRINYGFFYKYYNYKFFLVEIFLSIKDVINWVTSIV